MFQMFSENSPFIILLSVIFFFSKILLNKFVIVLTFIMVQLGEGIEVDEGMMVWLGLQ